MYVDVEDNTSRPLNRECIADLPLMRTLLTVHQKPQQPLFWEVLDAFVLLAYASLLFGRFKNLLQWLLDFLNIALDSNNLFCWYKQKKWFLWTMAVAQAAENHGDE